MSSYSSIAETKRIFDQLLKLFEGHLSLPIETKDKKDVVSFTGKLDKPYFPIPFKETETAAALKAIEGSVAALLADSKYGAESQRKITVDQEKTTAFLFQAYLARVDGLGKMDKEVRKLLKDTDLLQAQSDPYRRMAANLYETAEPGEYYHIHGSLEASTTLGMLGLPSHNADIDTQDKATEYIEPAVRKFTVAQLEEMNAKNRQAGVKAFKHAEFLETPHGKHISQILPWTVEDLETKTPPTPLPEVGSSSKRLLAGVKVLELCRIIAGPVITRILGEYGADVLKITSPHLSDVPFFQVDGNMGKHAADLDLKTPEGRAAFEELVQDVDIIVDGYRPGAFDKLGYGAEFMAALAEKRGKGIVYVNENCFGYGGEWSHRPGWQQIADCVSGVAWEQGRFMGLDEPIVPPFPLSDYGTGCMGAIAALTGLYHRTTRGGSWHGKVSLLQYDMLLFKVGLLPEATRSELRKELPAEFLAIRHAHSVDQISGAALGHMRATHPDFVDDKNYLDHWYSAAYGQRVAAVKPVVNIEGLEVGFVRANRPNGSDKATWQFGEDGDYRVDA